MGDLLLAPNNIHQSSLFHPFIFTSALIRQTPVPSLPHPHRTFLRARQPSPLQTMHLPCSAPHLLFLLLLLPGALGAQEESSFAKEKMHEWANLRKKIEDEHSYEEGKYCDVSPDLTHAYFLLSDLIYFHPNSVLTWAWPRYDFYSSHFNKLVDASDRKFCSYADVIYRELRLVCDNNKCAKCEGLRKEADAKLHKACAYNGNGGSDVPSTPKEGGRIPEPEVWTPSEEDCQPGWLTAVDAFELIRNMTNGRQMNLLEPCDYSPALAVGFTYAFNLSFFHGMERVKEIEDNREFWEDKLRILKDGKGVGHRPCNPMLEIHDGLTTVQRICGKDSICVSCDDVKDDNYEACTVQNPTKDYKVNEECAILLQKKNATTESSSAAPIHRQLALTLLVSTATLLVHCN